MKIEIDIKINGVPKIHMESGTHTNLVEQLKTLTKEIEQGIKNE